MAKISTSTAIPKMTSNTLPSGIASSSSENNTTTLGAWRAFDGDFNSATNGWTTVLNVKTGWLRYEFQTSKIISKYSIAPVNSIENINRSPNSWTFEGSNDGSTWDILDTRTNISDWTVLRKKEFSFSNVNSYKNYRINITLNNGGAYVAIGELEMFEVVLESALILKNNSNFYSLKKEELIELPSINNEVILKYGITNGLEIKLNTPFNKIKYIKDTKEVLGGGKIFTHQINNTTTKIKKIIL